MIDFSKIQEDEFTEDAEQVVAPDDLFRIALPVLKVHEADPSWRLESLCLSHPDVSFFDGFQKKQAKAICGQCAVSERCLQFALENNEMDGVWGGLDTDDRKVLVGKQSRKAYR
jgi:WhiB family redox-sensing transcriptional regulator